MRQTYTKEQYKNALKLKSNLKRKEIAEKLNINPHTLDTWFYWNKKPHCLSPLWKRRNMLTIKNLGNYSIPKKIDIPKLKNSPELAYLIGVYLGDGNSYEGFDMVTIDYEFANKVAGILTKISGRMIEPKHYKRLHKDGRREEGYRVRLSSVLLKKYLERVTDNKKIIPRKILSSNKMIKWGVFFGFLDSEGSVFFDSKDKNSGRISISQKTKGILFQFKKLISNLSIKGGIIKDSRHYYEHDNGQYDKENEVYAACGAAVLMSKKVLEKIERISNLLFVWRNSTCLMSIELVVTECCSIR